MVVEESNSPTTLSLWRTLWICGQIAIVSFSTVPLMFGFRVHNEKRPDKLSALIIEIDLAYIDNFALVLSSWESVSRAIKWLVTAMGESIQKLVTSEIGYRDICRRGAGLCSSWKASFDRGCCLIEMTSGGGRCRQI